MARHGVDGVFLRRYITEIDSGPGDGFMRLRDEVCGRVWDAAEGCLQSCLSSISTKIFRQHYCNFPQV
jgi:hypothetical protein